MHGKVIQALIRKFYFFFLIKSQHTNWMKNQKINVLNERHMSHNFFSTRHTKHIAYNMNENLF
jgi:hypothetical protein